MEQKNYCISNSEFILRLHYEAKSGNFMRDRYSSSIMIVISGCTEIVYQDTTVHLHPGDAIFVPEHSNYHYDFCVDTEMLVINFHLTESVDEIIPLRKCNIQMAIHLFETLDTLLISPENNRNRIFSIYYQFLSLFFDRTLAQNTTNEFLKKAESIIQNEFASPDLTPGSIAQRLNISEVYLRKLFSRHRNSSPSKYLLQTRMNYAQHFLSCGYSISAVAKMCGYADVYHFSRTYKKYYGYSPSKTTAFTKLKI